MTETSRILIRAANPDNRREVDAIIGLFFRVYGDQYPFAVVYERSYWATLGGGRFRSLVAYLDGDLVGHIALRPYFGNSSFMELCLVAYDAERIGCLDSVMNGVQAVLRNLALRQRWQLAYCYSFSSLPILQGIATEGFGFKEMAVCPAMACCRDGSRQTVIISQAPVLASENEPVPTRLFAPSWHRDQVELAFTSQGYRCKTSSSDGSRFSSSHAIIVHQEPVAIQGTEVFFVRSARDGNTQEQVSPSFSYDAASKSTNQYYFLDLTSPDCPSWCRHLEDSGFRYCGVLPQMRGIHSIIYTRYHDFHLNLNTLESSESKSIAHYHLNYESPQKIVGHTTLSLEQSVLTAGKPVLDVTSTMPLSSEGIGLHIRQ